MLLLLLLYGNRKRISLEAVSIYSLGVDLKAVTTEKTIKENWANKNNFDDNYNYYSDTIDNYNYICSQRRFLIYLP